LQKGEISGEGEKLKGATSNKKWDCFRTGGNPPNTQSLRGKPKSKRLIDLRGRRTGGPAFKKGILLKRMKKRGEPIVPARIGGGGGGLDGKKGRKKKVFMEEVKIFCVMPAEKS